MPTETLKQDVKEALIDLIISGDIQMELPDPLMEDSIRRNRHVVRDMIDYSMQNGGFPKDKVTGMLDDRLSDYRVELRAALVKMVEDQQIFRMKVLKPDGGIIETGLQHHQFGELLDVVQAGLNAYLVGPAGSGKTTAAEMVAKALNLPFYFTGAITSEFKLTGFIDANGRVICPAFRRAYESGGVFLFDEIDGSMAQAVLAFNAAIANSMMDFPDKSVPKHPNFHCIAAANTYGFGADRVYVGRNQLDGATVDRFVFIDWGYDEKLERTLANNDDWVNHVHKVRKAVAQHKIRHVVSPRASMNGAKMLALGVKRPVVEKSVIYKGLDVESVEKIKASIK